MTYPEARLRIMVGVDDSAAARAALTWAGRHARVTGAELVVLHAWGDLLGRRAPYVSPAALAEETALRADAEAVAAAAVAAVGEEYPEVPVRSLVCRERASLALLRHAAEADLLVLGCRPVGAAAYTGATLRSCLALAPCPTVAVSPGHVGRPADMAPPNPQDPDGSPLGTAHPAYA
ncbi:nucleotide-binding universal stress UspA family protein [Streptosporangium becharense]|uniref:Nucleotide-binding universal stress UspA family protein n=1 Tax=Streptosporangium becharense TaxID=1816182 RepID=A0A7W9IB66_9ACTN|nr:universal stress protein [Streptosporangium becharense]MBB2910820.1 nucleotide-binding universal stress UspA family protein [Streptosporangium becharense]MBB5817515.1 nucleotide-binding universal stress UspA family protein [Streptosporangium becharense]